MSNFHRIYRKIGPIAESMEFKSLRQRIYSLFQLRCGVEMEYCYNIETTGKFTSSAGGDQSNEAENMKKVAWLIAETFEPNLLCTNGSFFAEHSRYERIVEVGPRLTFSTAWCSNCLSMLQACGVNGVRRIERSRRIKFIFETPPSEEHMSAITALLYDRMTECVYATPLTSFGTGAIPAPVVTIPVLELGRSAIEAENEAKGLGFDAWDLDYYTKMFAETLKRNPTDVELFDLGQSNSEHSRHWFFNGKIHLNGIAQPETLFQMVKSTLPRDQPSNSVIAFHDNSSAIRGCEVPVLVPRDSSSASVMVGRKRVLHPILTAETHNFPSGVAPFAGAETGTGGRIRDVQATGRGAHTLAGVCGYCVGNLHIPDHPLPWEQPLLVQNAQAVAQGPTPAQGGQEYKQGHQRQQGNQQHGQEQAACGPSQRVVEYPGNLASPLNIIIQASNGASDYGNKFGEPVVTGFARSFGQQIPTSTYYGRHSHLHTTQQLAHQTPALSWEAQLTQQQQQACKRQRVEWLKPVMFTAGVGLLDDRYCVKGEPEPGMLVCKIGGPAYRIGVGGGAASSRVQLQTPTIADSQCTLAQPITATDLNQQQEQQQQAQEAELDFNAVQRGDAEMQNRMNRVLRACIELGDSISVGSGTSAGTGARCVSNPIVSIHDQGAGGNGNVLKEIVAPLGARIRLKDIPSGDPTLSALELWGAEYQENNALLVRPDPTVSGSQETGAGEGTGVSEGEGGMALLQRIAARENCPVAAVGTVTGDGWMVVEAGDGSGSTPYNMPLSLVLGDAEHRMPKKHFHFVVPPCSLPATATASPAAETCATVGTRAVKTAASRVSDTRVDDIASESAIQALVSEALGRVLRLLDVGSKRFLTNKVDRSVTGLVAQQQCVGPLHTPLADVAVLAQSHFATTGIAVAVGEQPLKGLVSPAAQARMTLVEALSNLVFADITSLQDVKASCNWMWPAKVSEPLPWLQDSAGTTTDKHTQTQTETYGNMEGARMYEACSALRDCMLLLGVGIDGGKDSLTMAAKVGEEVVKCPGQVVLTCYAPCTDIAHTLTPDFKHPDTGVILFVDLGEGHHRLAGTALSTVYPSNSYPPDHRADQYCPDMSYTALQTFQRCFCCIQECLRAGWLQSGHDISDGGLIAALLEMAFAGNTSLQVTLTLPSEDASTTATQTTASAVASDLSAACLSLLFSEEAGFLLEVLPKDLPLVLAAFAHAQVPAQAIGTVTSDQLLYIECVSNTVGSDAAAVGNKYTVLQGPMTQWRDVWESTSFALERLQCDTDCVQQEMAGLALRTVPPYHLTYTPEPCASSSYTAAGIAPVTAVKHATQLESGVLHNVASEVPRAPTSQQHRVAVLRQEGTNGDREMCAAFHTAGFEVWDVNMHDLLSGAVTLNAFRGVAFCGGFSYADVNDSAKGWAGSILFNPLLLAQFCAFRDRADTFSLGVCNGCQLLALLGWVPFDPTTVATATASAGESTAVPSVTTAVTGSGAAADIVGVSVAQEQSQHESQARFVRNLSGRFESRWSAVKVLPSPAVLLQGMEGSTLGIWVSHGEGRAYFPHAEHLDLVLQQGLAPLRYVDDGGTGERNEPTMAYPCNPNGSPHGIAALCSPNGRHLALMPHPERCFLKWQIAYLTVEDKQSLRTAPWLRLFQNAQCFCDTVVSPAADV